MSGLVYKYTRPENWDHFFKKWSIRFTPPEDLNDPYDCRPYIYDDDSKLSEERCQELKSSKEYVEALKYKYRQSPPNGMSEDEFIEFTSRNFNNLLAILNSDMRSRIKYSDEMIRYFRSNYGVLSLTKKCNDILMWTHYADCHKGFVVGIHEDAGMFEGILHDVIYVEDRPKVSFQDIINDKYNNLTKSNIWEYENELRAIIPFSDNKKVSWIDGAIKGVAQLPKNSVSCIIFGAAMQDDEIKDKSEKIQSQDGCEHIVLQRVTLHPDKFEFVIEPIV